jgi:nucleoside phosphorylase
VFVRDLRDGQRAALDEDLGEPSPVEEVRHLVEAGDDGRLGEAVRRFVDDEVDGVMRLPKRAQSLPARISALFLDDKPVSIQWQLRRILETQWAARFITIRERLRPLPRAFQRFITDLPLFLSTLRVPAAELVVQPLIEKLSRTSRPWFLGRRFLRVEALKLELLDVLGTYSQTFFRRLTLATAIETADQLAVEEREYWVPAEELYPLWERSHAFNHDAERILLTSLDRLDPSARDIFRSRFLSRFQDFYTEYRESRDRAAFDAWLEGTRELFAKTFAEPYVSPSLHYSDDDLTEAIDRLDAGVFVSDHSDPSEATASVTIIVPHGFAGSAEYARALAERVKVHLRTHVVVAQPEGVPDGEIVFFAESHFQPFQAIRGVADLEEEYRKKADPTEYHFDRNWPTLLSGFIDSLSTRRTAGPLSRAELPRRFDIGLVVPLHEEFEIVASHWPIKGSETSAGTTFLELDMSAAGVTCVATVLREMGPSVAASRTEKLLNFADVSLVVLLGIAGSLRSDVELADVVIADEVAEFHAASKAVPDGDGSFRFQYSGFHFRAQYSLIEAIAHWSHLARTDHLEWKNGIRSQAPGLDDDHPRLHVEHVASGDTVGAAEAFRIELLGIDRRFAALEMEGAGVARAADTRQPATPFLIIRGISDYSDERKKTLDRTRKGVWRSAAVHSACDALTRLLRLQSVRSAAKLAPRM